MTEVVVTETGEPDLTALEAEVRERIFSKLDEAADWPDHHLKRVSNGAYSLRVGDYRVICDWVKSDDRIVVFAAGHRRNVYDRTF